MGLQDQEPRMQSTQRVSWKPEAIVQVTTQSCRPVRCCGFYKNREERGTNLSSHTCINHKVFIQSSIQKLFIECQLCAWHALLRGQMSLPVRKLRLCLWGFLEPPLQPEECWMMHACSSLKKTLNWQHKWEIIRTFKEKSTASCFLLFFSCTDTLKARLKVRQHKYVNYWQVWEKNSAFISTQHSFLIIQSKSLSMGEE